MLIFEKVSLFAKSFAKRRQVLANTEMQRCFLKLAKSKNVTYCGRLFIYNHKFDRLPNKPILNYLKKKADSYYCPKLNTTVHLGK